MRDMGNTPGQEDKYNDLVRMAERGETQVAGVVDLLEGRGYDALDVTVSGLLMGPGYFRGYFPNPGFRYAAQLLPQPPYSDGISFPTTIGEFSFGASVGVGLSHVLLGGKPSGQAPVPLCQNATCGDDGCGGSCGTCGDGLTCSAGQCVGAGADAGAGDDAGNGNGNNGDDDPSEAPGCCQSSTRAPVGDSAARRPARLRVAPPPEVGPLMELKQGDVVEIVAIPSRIERAAPAERDVYRTCLGFKLVIVRVEDDGRCFLQLQQEWSHFPDVTPFDLEFDAACLRKVEPFSDAEWASLSGWMEHDASLSSEVIAVDGTLKVRLEGGIIGDLMLPDDASKAHDVGTTLPVRIVMLNRKRRDLVVCPAGRSPD